MDWIIEHWLDIVTVITYLVTAASLVVKWTPTEVDNNVLAKVIEILKIISLNKK